MKTKKTVWVVYCIHWERDSDIFHMRDAAAFPTKEAAERFVDEMPPTDTVYDRQIEEIPFGWFEVPTTEIRNYE